MGELDNRGSHFYLALYWAKALAEQADDADLAKQFAPISAELVEKEQQIVSELNNAQGAPGDLGGYYLFDDAKVTRLMRSSDVFNSIVDSLK